MLRMLSTVSSNPRLSAPAMVSEGVRRVRIWNCKPRKGWGQVESGSGVIVTFASAFLLVRSRYEE